MTGLMPLNDRIRAASGNIEDNMLAGSRWKYRTAEESQQLLTAKFAEKIRREREVRLGS
jgi:hypothetical protein